MTSIQNFPQPSQLTQSPKTAPTPAPSPTSAVAAPQRSQQAYDSARQRAGASGAKAVDPSQAVQEISGQLERNAPKSLADQARILSQSQAISDTFGKPPVKAVYALGSDETVRASARSIADKVGAEGSKAHCLMEHGQLASLGPHDKLTLVGHGDDHSFGGQTPEQLAKHLKDSGISALDKISLKGCNSDHFAQQLMTALKAEGIEVKSISGRSDQVAIASNGRTLVKHGEQLLHQLEGSKVVVTSEGVSKAHTGNTLEKVQARSLSIEKLGHHGMLPLTGKDVVDAGSSVPPPKATGELAKILNKYHVDLQTFVLGETKEAKAAIKAYLASRPEPTAQADLMMLRSLTAMSLLHQDGYFDNIMQANLKPNSGTAEKHQALKTLASEADGQKDEILEAYGLSHNERKAIEFYTNAHTNGLMKAQFGSAELGWQYLASAIEKLPSTGSLGLIHSGFRVPRKGEGDNIGSLQPGDMIRHGHNIMDQGQKHFMSVATTYNVHTEKSKVDGARCLVAIEGTSGRYINPFGVMSTMTDGAEVLYPPEVHSTYLGAQAVSGINVEHLREASQWSNPKVVFEDANYQPIQNPRILSEATPLMDGMTHNQASTRAPIVRNYGTFP